MHRLVSAIVVHMQQSQVLLCDPCVSNIAGEEKQALKIGGDDIVDTIPEGKVSVIEKAETNLAAGDGSRGKLICTHFKCVPKTEFLRPFL